MGGTTGVPVKSVGASVVGVPAGHLVKSMGMGVVGRATGVPVKSIGAGVAGRQRAPREHDGDFGFSHLPWQGADTSGIPVEYGTVAVVSSLW